MIRRAMLLLLGLVSLQLAGCSVARQLQTARQSPATLDVDMLLEMIDLEEQLVTRVYEQVAPSVVHITSRALQASPIHGIVPQEGTGSGFIFDKEGHIVTNFHVIQQAQTVQAALQNGTSVPARVVGVDPPNDLAVLQVAVPADQLTPVTLGDSDSLRVGQRVVAVGNPFGLERTLTTGVVSAVGRNLNAGEDRVLGKVIQTDAAINPGNSGGPLLDSRGRVIGVNTAIRSPNGGSVGIGFAVPVSTVKRVVPYLIVQGYYPHPWLGAEFYEIDPILSVRLELPVSQGLLVASLYPGGPAASAGVRGPRRIVEAGGQRYGVGGDIILAIDGQVVNRADELAVYLENEKQVGDMVAVTVLREDRPLSIPVIAGELPRP
ncbi:MAG: S1C family serine protease [Anaerolineae bacterium]